MACFSGPEIPNEGLILYYDQGNTDKSWKGPPAVNLAASNFFNGNGANFTINEDVSHVMPDGSTGVARLLNAQFVSDANRTVSIGSYALVAGQTYTLSFYVMNIDCTGFSGNLYSPTLSRVIGNITYPTVSTQSWTRVTTTFTVPNEGPNPVTLAPQVFRDGGNGRFKLCWLQLEQNSFATPYVSGTRSNTQAIVDLTGRNTVTASSLTYSSDNTFSFDGIDDTVTANLTGIPNFSALTLNVWFYSNVNTSTCLINNLPFILHFRGAGFYLRSSDGVSASGYLGWQALPPENIWNMLTATWDGSTMKLYLNGTKQSNELSYSGGTTGLLRANENVTVGGYFNTTQPWTNGKIGQAAIYNIALSAEEVQQNFNALRGRYGI